MLSGFELYPRWVPLHNKKSYLRKRWTHTTGRWNLNLWMKIQIAAVRFPRFVSIQCRRTSRELQHTGKITMGINLTCKWGKFFNLYMCRHPRALKSLAKITDTKPVFSANAISLASRQMFVTTLGGGKGYFFSVVLGLQSFSASSAWNARKVSNSQPKPLTIRNFPASSLEHLIFCQPARFLWGTDKVRNRFVGCPCLDSTNYRKNILNF